MGKNSIGGGEEIAEANRESAAHRERGLIVLSSSFLRPNSESSSSRFASNSSPLSQLSSWRCGVKNLNNFRASTSKSIF